MITSNYKRVNGFNVKYDTAGNPGSPVLLLIHGWASSSRMWHEVMGNLAGDYFCIAPDLPGFGESAKPLSGWYTLPNFVKFLLDFSRVLGIQRAHVVGHSLGGMISLALAGKHPRQVDRLVPVNPVVTGQVWLNMGRFAGAPLHRPVMAVARALWPIAISPMLTWPLHDKMITGPGMRRRREDLAKSTADSVLGTIRALAEYNTLDLLPAITAPTMVMIGERDGTVPPAEGRLAAERIPGARLVHFPGGHLLSDEHPEAFVAVLREFLA